MIRQKSLTRTAVVDELDLRLNGAESSVTKPEKVVRRSVALALGTVCIILIAGVAGALAYITPIINSKNNLIASLNSQISSKDSEISQLNSTITNLQNQVNNLTSTLAHTRPLSVTYKTDNYESWPTGSDGNNWTYVNSGGSTITKSSREAYGGSYSIYVNDAPLGYAYTSCYFSTPTTGNYHVRVYFWINSSVQMDVLPIFAGYSSEGTQSIQLEVIHSEGTYYLGYYDGITDSDTELASVSAGNWQQVDSYYLYSSGQQDIYLNGAYLGRVAASSANSTASYCCQGDTEHYSWYSGGVYIDDLTVDNSLETAPATQQYAVTTLGTTTSNEYFAGSSVDAALFDGCLLFWRNLTGYWMLTAFNLTSRRFLNVYTSQGQNWPSGANPACEDGGFVVGGTFYTGYGWENEIPPYFTSTVICTTDLATFTTLGNVNMSLESLCDYTGGGAYNNTIYFGGYQSFGAGTYSQIDRWYDGADQFVWNATVDYSNDVCFLTMYNSTCMIGSDCAPNAIIYTNDGVNFVDERSSIPVGSFTAQYPFVWAWSCYVDPTSGTAYIAAPASPVGANYYGDYSGGMATWTGAGTYTPTSWDPINLYTVSNGLVGGSDNYLNGYGNWIGHPAIYAYSFTGGFGYKVWSNFSDTGAVLSLLYSAANSAWYGLYYDVVSENVTIISITVIL